MCQDTAIVSSDRNMITFNFFSSFPRMIRVLILTSTIGLFGAHCYFKVLSAQLISLLFLVAFLIVRPYRKRVHLLMQALVMLVPVMSMARRDSAEDFFRHRAAQQAWIVIPAYCFAIP